MARGSQVDVCRVRPDWAEARISTALATPLARAPATAANLDAEIVDLAVEIEVLETTPVELTLSQRLPRAWRQKCPSSPWAARENGLRLSLFLEMVVLKS